MPPKQTVSQFQLKGRYARQYLSFARKSSKDFLLYCLAPVCMIPRLRMWRAPPYPAGTGISSPRMQEQAGADIRTWISNIRHFFFNGLPAKTAAVKAWLLSPIGYQKLQDTYDPDFFRMAVCKDALAFDITAQKAAEMELTFNCKPQRWSVDGQRVIRLDGRSTLKNPFAFPAQPIFKVYGDSGGELYVGEQRLRSTAFRTMCCSTVRRTMPTTLPASAMRQSFRMISRNCRKERHRSHGQAVSRRWR